MKTSYTIKQLIHEIEILKNTFSIVRLVNPSKNLEYKINADTLLLEASEYNCHSIWEKGEICKNCISLKSLQNKSKYTKFEFINNDIYLIVARYITVDDLEIILEIVSSVDNSTLLDVKGTNEFVDRITNYNDTLYTDYLTGVYNRKYFNNRIPFLLNQSKNKDSNIGIAMIDLDFFKSINDSCGHLFGDKVLCTVAQFLQSNINPCMGDFVARFGGDEFLIVLNNVDYDIYTKKLSDILKRSQTITIADYKYNLKLGLSIGGAHSSELNDSTTESLTLLADKRLYNSKQNGRSQVSY